MSEVNQKLEEPQTKFQIQQAAMKKGNQELAAHHKELQTFYDTLQQHLDNGEVQTDWTSIEGILLGNNMNQLVTVLRRQASKLFIADGQSLTSNDWLYSASVIQLAVEAHEFAGEIPEALQLCSGQKVGYMTEVLKHMGQRPATQKFTIGNPASSAEAIAMAEVRYEYYETISPLGDLLNKLLTQFEALTRQYIRETRSNYRLAGLPEDLLKVLAKQEDLGNLKVCERAPADVPIKIVHLDYAWLRIYYPPLRNGDTMVAVHIAGGTYC